MLIHGVSWKDYVILREALDTPGLRMTYCEEVLELMSPSRAHELWKKTIARLIELYAFLRGLPLLGYGSTTFRREVKERGAEPDECWCVGVQLRDGEFPQIVLEVIVTNPLLDKLDVYDGFEVPEVWQWREGELRALPAPCRVRRGRAARWQVSCARRGRVHHVMSPHSASSISRAASICSSASATSVDPAFLATPIAEFSVSGVASPRA